MVDFHIHTIFSDGTDDIETILEKTKDLDYFAITDHDSIMGIKYMLNNNIMPNNFIPGIEITTRDLDDSVHILFYNYDINSVKLNELIKRIDTIRHNRLIERIKILKSDFGIKLKKEDLNYLLSLDNPTKPHIGRILIKYGYAKTIDDAIKTYMFHKLKTKKVSSEEVITLLKDEKGTLVFAHPFGGIGEKRIEKNVLNERINRFKKYGIDGLECCYSLYDKEESDYLIEMANMFNLLISGGSDYHGKNKNVKIAELSKDDNNNYTLINLQDIIKH
jgi:predicted metal-dependent phosphoesterase TrpH